MEWQPIETAPKSGPVFVHDPDFGPVWANKVEAQWLLYTSEEEEVELKPAWWLDLVDPDELLDDSYATARGECGS